MIAAFTDILSQFSDVRLYVRRTALLHHSHFQDAHDDVPLLVAPPPHSAATTYRGKTATWAKGRQLASYDGHTYTYDGQGRRLTKDSISYTYDINGKLLKQSNGLDFFYDHTGVVGVIYNGNTYLYRKDVLGNILAILDSNGGVVARYIYDACGNHSVINANGAIISDASHIANLNPFRYRGYYFDTIRKIMLNFLPKKK